MILPPDYPVSMTCSRRACEQPARWLVGMRFRTLDKPPAPTEAALGLSVCLLHGVLLDMETLLTDSGRQQLEQAHVRIGRALPDWTTAETVLLPLESTP